MVLVGISCFLLVLIGLIKLLALTNIIMILPSGIPLFVELRSISDAKKYQGSKLGLYHLTPDPRVVETKPEWWNQSLVFRKLQKGNEKERFYLYRCEMRLH